MPQTISEKVLTTHTGRQVQAGEYITLPVNRTLISDTTGPLTIQAFREMGGQKVFNPDQVIVFIDHATPCPNSTVANLHQMLRNFAAEQGLRLYDAGAGICHQLMVEEGLVRPGDIVFGADSHTCTYGGIGAFATGIGSTDAAAILLSGKIWLKVPDSIRIHLKGPAQPGMGKDIALAVTGLIGAEGGNYATLEYQGSSLAENDRLTLANMAVETGAKNAFFNGAPYSADHGCHYRAEYEIDLAKLAPMVACPHQVSNVQPAADLSQVKVDQVFIGSCTNGRYADLEVAARMLAGKKVHPQTRLIVSPASRRILLEAIASGVLQTLVEAGATVLSPGCNACVGTLGGVPGDGENVLSTGNRNFIGRMGNNKAHIYLASAATAAASALNGCITDYRELGA